MSSLTKFESLLGGKDLRSLGRCYALIPLIKTQRNFDILFKFLVHPNRAVVMRAADVMEKITSNNPQFLTKHKRDLIELFYIAKNKELKWHLAAIIPRLQLKEPDFSGVWNTLLKWVKDVTNSRLVRVGAIQGLYEMSQQKSSLRKNFQKIMLEVEKQNIPSVNARIRNIRKEQS